MPNKPFSITNITARKIREARENGKTLLQIAAEFGVSISTAQRYSDDAAAEKQRKYQRDKWRRMVADPVANAEALEKQRKRRAAYRAEYLKVTSKGKK